MARQSQQGIFYFDESDAEQKAQKQFCFDEIFCAMAMAHCVAVVVAAAIYLIPR